MSVLVVGVVIWFTDRTMNQQVPAAPSEVAESSPITKPAKRTADAFVLSTTILEPYWTKWKKEMLKGKIVIMKGDEGRFTSMRGDLTNQSGEKVLAAFNDGLPVVPTVDGSSVSFEGYGIPVEWVNKIKLKSTSMLEFKVVADQGLVHIAGTGTLVLPDGNEASLIPVKVR